MDGPYNGAQIELSGNAEVIGAATGSGDTLENKGRHDLRLGAIGNGGGATGGAGLWPTNDHSGVIDANGAADHTLVINTGTKAINKDGTKVARSA